MTIDTSPGPFKRDLYGTKDLARLIRPASIAIVGASATPGSFGHRTVLNAQLGFKGAIYPVNPKAREILGLAAYAAIDHLPRVPDCVVLAIPKEHVVEQIELCARLGVGGAVIFTSGFAEGGDPAGTAMQERISEVSRASGLRVLGPNCLGLLNVIDQVGLTFQPGLSGHRVVAGSIGLVSQSGGLGSVIVQGMQRGVGFSYNFSAGNSCDVDICDLVNFLVEDESTKAIACALEGVRDGSRLVEVARRAAALGKPLIVHKMGNNDLSRQTALSHTGTMAGSNAAYSAAFERGNAIVVEDFEAILETVAFFSKAGKPKAPGIGVMSASGGAAVMAADRASDVGVSLPPLASETAARLSRVIPNFGSNANPCDITAASVHDKGMYGEAIKTFADDPSFAAVVVPMMTAQAPATVERATYLTELASAMPAPICIVWLNEWYEGPGSEVYDSSAHVSIFRSMRRCMQTLKLWIDYHDRLARMAAPGAGRVTTRQCAKAAKQLIGQSGGASVLTERASKKLLAAYGVDVTREDVAMTADAAVALAQRFGYPVVLKAESAAIPHKTEAGVVHLDLRTQQQVRAAFDAIRSKVASLPGPVAFEGVLVQEMVKIDLELIVGATRDAQFGPLVVVGVGGIFVELLRDTACALAPVDKAQARAMLESLKGARLLSGFRGSRPVNFDLLAESVARISELASDLHEEVGEMDVNPLVASGERIVAVDALVALRKEVQS